MGIFKNIFGKKNRSFQLKPDEIKPILVNKGGCLATNKITIDGCQVGYMYREDPKNELDNGWRFFSGTESQEYVDDKSNTQVYDLNTIVNYDSSIIPYVDLPIGSELERITGTDEFNQIK